MFVQNDAQLRQDILSAVRTLEERRLNVGSTGNVSVRHGQGLLITPTGATSDTLSADGIVSLTLGGQVLSGGIPSSEWAFHTTLLSDRPEFGAVIHTHADACVALSCLRRAIPAFHYMIASFGGDDVRCADYAPFGSDALAQSASVAMQGRRACLLANHGMIVAGHDLAHALQLAEKLETLARQYLLACQAGDPVILSTAQMAEVHARYAHYGRGPMPR
ncbi:MAG: class II aldolase/adducin family protein [Gemmobacter sp.]|nr:class II aldolase/adducin family protein [Gemmobacter sp.]